MFQKLEASPTLRLLLTLAFCFVMGGLSSLAMAPNTIWPLLFAGLGSLYYIVAYAKSSKSAFSAGWFFGFGYFLFGLSWIGNALLVEGNPYAWAWPLAISGLPLVLSIFPALACMLAKRFADLTTLSGYLSFTAWLLLSEFARGYLFTGFPWNLYGYAWSEISPITQSVFWINIYGLTGLTILWASLLGFLALKDVAAKKKALASTLCALIFAFCYTMGAHRLTTESLEYHDNIQVRLIQPNIPQHEKWDQRKMTQNFFKLIRMLPPTLHDPELETTKATYIIWPETAISHWYTKDQTSMGLLTDALNESYQGDAYIFTGLLDRDIKNKTYSNSLVMINKKGELRNIYNKHHLVPFGEYIPFKKWIPIETVTDFSGFVAGEGPKTYKTPQGLSYTPLICYEAIFPGLTPRGKDQGPDFLINVTNDAWYGFSAGPHQHLAQTRFRAIEEGLPLIRAANTGVSVAFDPLGRIIQEASLFTEASMTFSLPQKLEGKRQSQYIQHLLILLTTLLMIAVGYKKKP